MKNIGFVSLNSGGTMGHMSLLTNLTNQVEGEYKCFIFSEHEYKNFSNLKNKSLKFIKIKKQVHNFSVAGCLNYKYKDYFLKLIKKNKIDILIFSTFFDKELIKKARKIVKKVFLISYPLRDSHREAFFVNKLYNLFDKIFTLKDIVKFSRKYPNEIIALSPNFNLKFKASSKKSNQILITCGGGGRPSSEIFFRIIKANLKEILTKYPQLEFIVITGNSRFNFKSERVKIVHWANNFIELVKGSDFIISEAGYFTIMELLSLNKPALIIPGSRRIDNQELRAITFQRLGKGLFMLPEQNNKDFLDLFYKMEKFHISKKNIIKDLSGIKLDDFIYRELA